MTIEIIMNFVDEFYVTLEVWIMWQIKRISCQYSNLDFSTINILNARCVFLFLKRQWIQLPAIEKISAILKENIGAWDKNVFHGVMYPNFESINIAKEASHDWAISI